MGGSLVSLVVPPGAIEERKTRWAGLPSLRLSERSGCDLEHLATCGFSPMDRFMGEEDLRPVLGEMRLADGHLFPISFTLPADPAPDIGLDGEVDVRDARNELLAIMTVEEVYHWDLEEVAFQSRNPLHRAHEEIAAAPSLRWIGFSCYMPAWG